MKQSNVELLAPLDDRVVLFGQSCAGKTTFASLLSDRTYYCFDAMFHWHLIETLGLSIEANLQYVKDHCTADRYVLDGWHLADKRGRFLPPGAMIYVVFAPYETIIAQYRIPVTRPDEHRAMHRRWYQEVQYSDFGARYFLNDGDFSEITQDQFYAFLRT